jgi:hypothetical protein
LLLCEISGLSVYLFVQANYKNQILLVALSSLIPRQVIFPLVISPFIGGSAIVRKAVDK